MKSTARGGGHPWFELAMAELEGVGGRGRNMYGFSRMVGICVLLDMKI